VYVTVTISDLVAVRYDVAVDVTAVVVVCTVVEVDVT
jgi:hypothetical protein